MGQPTPQPAEGNSVPPLQIGPQLKPAAGGGEGSSVVAGVRVGLIALAAAVAIAAALLVIAHRSHGTRAVVPKAPPVPVSRHPAPAPSARGAAYAQPIFTSATSAVVLGGERLASTGLPAFAAARRATHPVISYVHDLSPSDLTSLADGSTTYEPPAYLADAYQQAAQRYGVPWRVLAAIEYIQGGYATALAGPSAGALQAVAAEAKAGRQRAVNPRALAGAVDATNEPSAKLLADAGKLAVDGANQSTVEAVYKFTNDSSTSGQAVMTLAQEIGSAAVTSTSGPKAKLVVMQDEAHLLNGLPYIWGGGHTDPAWVVGSGYDCSGFVSEVLHSAGYLSSPDTTQTLPGSAGIAKGAGEYVTIYDRTDGGLKVWRQKRNAFLKKLKAATKNLNVQGVHVTHGRTAAASVSLKLPPGLAHPPTFNVDKPNPDNSLSDDHVIVNLDGQWWESGGDTANGGAAQVHRIDEPSKSYLNSFNLILHPSGL